ncbi:ATP-grasp domain-containing protein [Candidatus Saccharibacteria bacterium]|nr:ATP-grasp domain-containing protein [Candidatus Saccharibacteria bacterium]
MNTINLIAGFDPDNPLNDDLERAANKVGYNLRRITHIDSEKIRTGDLQDELPDNVLWRRELFQNTPEENDLVWKWLDENKKITMNTHVNGGRIQSMDKMFQQQAYVKMPELAENSIPTFVAKDVPDLIRIMNEEDLTFPLLLKPRYGTLGKGIVVMRDMQELLTAMTEIPDLTEMILEPYIDSDYDWRVFVIGGKGIGVMRKAGREGEPYDFEARSAGIQKWNETDEMLAQEMKRVAELAAKAMNLEYAGVDLIRDKNTGRIYVVETNISGGWYNGFSKITGVDVADKIVEWFVEQNKHLAK